MTFATDDEALAHDLWFAISFKIGSRLRHLDEVERRIVAKSIGEYLKLANWEFKRGPPGVGLGYLGCGPPK
jgi:hypothetical protein